MLKIVSYNVFNGNKGEELLTDIKKLIEQGVDLFCFQEVRGINNIEKKMKQALPKEWGMQLFGHKRENDHDFGVCFAWNKKRLKLVDYQCWLLPVLNRYNWFEDLIDSVLIGKHAPIKRGAMAGTFDDGQQKFRVVNMHLDWQGGNKQRWGQLKWIYDQIQMMPKADKEVICGDMNSLGCWWQFGKNRQDIELVLGDEYKNAFTETKATTNSVLKQELDHVYYKGFSLSDHKIITSMKGSDHFPLLVELEKKIKHY